MNTHTKQKANKTRDVTLKGLVKKKIQSVLIVCTSFITFWGRVKVLKKKRVLKYIPIYIFGRTKYVKNFTAL